MNCRRKIAAFSAAVMMLIPALSASADTGVTNKVTNVRLNKPYIGLTATKDSDIDISSMKFALKNSKGEVVAKFTGGGSSVTATKGLACDLTGITDETSFKKKDPPLSAIMEKYYPDSYKCTAPNGKATKNGESFYIDPAQGCYLSPADQLVLDYTDTTKFTVVDTMTLPAYTIFIETDKKYNDIQNSAEFFYLEPATSISQKNPIPDTTPFYMLPHAGKQVKLSASKGKYDIHLIGGSIGNDKCEVFDHAVTYSKVRMKFTDAFPGIVDDDLTVTKKYESFSGSYSVKLDLRGSMKEKVFYTLCHSGPVFTAFVPDSNGYVEFWVQKDDPVAKMSYTFSWSFKQNGQLRNGSGGGSIVTAYLPRTVEKIKVLMSFPKSGYCIGGLAPDKYTVVIDDRIDRRDYQISNSVINVTDSKNLQTANIKISKKPLLLGDCNRDGSINVSDVSIIAAHVKGVKKLDGRGPLTADVDGSKLINITDVSTIAAHVKAKRLIPEKWV